ncbi:MAG: xylulokinase [Firmicutes bacterium]|nr:xylulokinase [Bacillota bacterium]
MSDLYLGIDIGTSSTKVVAMDDEGIVHGLGRSSYHTASPQAGFAEQDPETWIQAVKESVRDVRSQLRESSRVRAIGMTGQMHGLVMLDARFQPLAPAILWPDTRSAQEVREIKERYGSKLFELTGGPTATGFLLSSLLWIKKHRQVIYDKIHVVLTPKDYVRLYLTGIPAMDPTDACGTGAFLPSVSCWAEELVNDLELDPKLFPKILPSACIAGSLLPQVAKELGLASDILIVTGCGDLQASAMGIGITSPEQLLVNVGTGGQVFQLLDHYAFDPQGRLHTMVHADGKSWHAMGAILAAGLSMSWIARIIGAEGDEMSSFFEASSGLIACEEDLFFLPYLVGERTPHMDEKLSASFWGLRAGHDKTHLFRAVLEGVAFALWDSFDVLSSLSQQPKVIRAGSGGLRDVHFRQLIADVFGLPLEYTNEVETSGLGAALLAQAGVSGADSGEMIDALVKPVGTIWPNMVRHRAYAEGFQRYRQLAQVMKELS